MSKPASLYEIAFEILDSGKDRIPQIDKRRIPYLRRHGLLIYLDGYSLTADAMREAARDFRLISREAAPHNPEKSEKLARFAVEAVKWADTHLVTPDIRKLRFGELPFEAYYELWQVATGHGTQAKECLTKKIWMPLTRAGYMEDDSDVPCMARVTQKGLELVREYGNPFLGIKTASTSYSYDRRR